VNEDVLKAALDAYDQGYMPIPLQNVEGGRKKPAIPSWREYQQQRPSRAIVEAWFQSGDFNMAILTGKVSGCIVVDLDGQIADPETWVFTHLGIAGPALIVGTGGGGAHLYYAHPGGTVSNGVKLATVDGVTVDLRADGGYVVAPPSIHDNGVYYEFVRGYWNTHLTQFPQELQNLIAKRTEHGALLASDVVGSNDLDQLLEGVGEGGRNHAAAKVCGYFLKIATDERAAWVMVKLWNEKNSPPLPEHELRQTFDSIQRREAAKPKDVVEVVQDDGSVRLVPTSLPAVMSGAEWANAVRHTPPRKGRRCDALPGIEAVGGLVPRDLVVLSGRPGTGKSTVGWNMVAEVCIQPRTDKLPSVVFSTEMTAADVARWMATKIFGPGYGEAQWHETLDMIARSPVTMCDVGGVSVDQICEIVRRIEGTKFVVVDHIQRIGSGKSYGENRNLEVGRIAQMLKSLAKDQGCTVLALSQMNRGAEGNGRPGLRSLRDSGEIEQEADAVILLWSREEDLTQIDLPVIFTVAKNRHGEMKEIECIFHKARKLFAPMGIFHELEKGRLAQQAAEQTRQMQLGG
jgi:KaiC/GvpD/RAD55 family RecA-like ATPase